MKQTGSRGLRFGLIALIVIISVLAVVTLTACQDKLTVADLSVVEDSVPDVIVAGDFNISDIKLTVTTEEGEQVEIAAESSMLTAEGRTALSTPGSKQITLYYQGHTVVVNLLVVEEGTETVKVVFLNSEGKQIAKKSAIKGSSITAPDAPEVEGKVFVAWVDATGAEADLTSVNSDLTVKASYSENATKHTVNFYDYTNTKISTITVNHGDKISQPNWTKPSAIDSYSWGIDFNTYTVTNNIDLHMTVTYKEATVQYWYAFESQPTVKYSLNISERVKIGGTLTKKTEAENAIKSKQLEPVNSNNYWQSDIKTIEKDTDMVATVKDRLFTISFKNNDHEAETLLTGTSYSLPGTAKPKVGYTFNNKWKGDDGATYSGTLTVIKDLVLEPVYNKKQSPVKVVFGFDGLEVGGNPVTETFTDSATYFEDLIDLVYIQNKFNSSVKSRDEQYADYEVESITFNGVEVTASGVVLGEVVGDDTNDFTVNMINKNTGTAGLVISEGKVTGYSGESKIIYIPAKKDSVDVTEIGDEVFKNKEIVGISIPASVTKLGNGVFEGATLGSDISLPAIATIGTGVFKNAKSAYVDENDTSKGRISIAVSFASGEGTFTTLPENTFFGADGISSVTLPAGVTNLGNYAFKQSTVASITDLSLVTTLGNGAFEGADAIVSLTLPKVKTIGTDAFKSMAKLTALTVATETVYENNEAKLAFNTDVIALSNALGTLTLGDGVGSLVADPTNLAGSTLSVINLPANLTAITNSADGSDPYGIFAALTDLTAINVSAGGSKFASDNGVLFVLGAESASLAHYPSGRAGNYTVPNTVNGKTVNEVDTDFGNVRINSVFLNDASAQAIISAAGADIGITANKVMNNLIINVAVLGNAVEQNMNYIRTSFPCADNYYINGSLDNFSTIASEAGWTNVFLYDENAVSKYDAASGLTYSVKDGKATVLYGDKTQEVITIPAKLGNCDVNAIASNAFAGYTNLTTLNVLATLKTIGADALKDANNLANISVAAWTDDAVIDAAVFEDTAWANSRNLLVLGGKLIAYNNLPADDLTGITTVITAEDLAGVKTIPDGFFKDMNNLTEVTLSSTVKTIGEEAFSGSGIVSIDFGTASNLGIGVKAFYNCASLVSVEINNAIGAGASAFEGCTSLKYVSITSAINNGYVAVAMFKDCSALETVVFENIIGLAKEEGKSNAFENCTSLENVDFIGSFAEIPAEAFKGCTSIKAVDFTKTSVTIIGQTAFGGCSGLEAVTLGSGINSIGNYAFTGCSELKSIRLVGDGGILRITVSDNVFPNPASSTYTIYVSASADTTAIEYYEARIATVLPAVSFDYLTGYNAGNNALNLDSVDTIFVDVAPDAPEFDGYVFDAWYINDGGYVKATFPITVTADMTLYAKYFSAEKGSLRDENVTYDSVNKVFTLISHDDNDVAFIPAEYTHATYGKHPIAIVNMDAFVGANKPQEIVLPEGITTIMAGASHPTALTYIYIPSTVTSIEDGAFEGATELEIEFAPDSMLVEVTKAAFTGTKWYVEEAADATAGGNNGFVIAGRMAIEYLGGAKQVTLPSDIYKVAENLFENNAVIEEIVLNDDLVYVGDEAFKKATKLEYVSYASGSRGNETSKIAYVNAGAFEGTKWLANQTAAIVGTILIKYSSITGDKIVNIPDYVTVINAEAFKNNGTVTSVLFGNNSALKEIGDEAFYNTQIAAITLPAVDKMGTSVFAASTKLKTADLSKVTFKSLPEETFKGCTALESVTLSATVNGCGDGVFDDCAKLSVLTAPSFNDTEAFRDSGITDSGCPLYNVEATEEDTFVIIGKILVKYVPGTAAIGEDGKTVTIPDGVEIIYNNVFESKLINTVIIPASVKEIQQNAFLDSVDHSANPSDAALKTVIFTGDGLEIIGNNAFQNCTALSSITLPTTLVKIGDYAFGGDDGDDYAFGGIALKNLVIPDSVTEIGSYAFYKTALETVEIGSGVEKIGEKAFGENESLYKATLGWDNAILDAINVNIAASLSPDNEENFSLFIKNVFKRDLTSKIRVYAERGLYNYVTTATAENYKVKSWNNDVAEFFTVGNFPQVSFDNSGYFMNAVRTEVLESVGVPVKTGHTFMGWYKHYDDQSGAYSDPLTLPYRIDADCTLYAKWFKNDLANVDGNPELEFLSQEGGSYYLVSGVDTSKVSDKTLYINSSVKYNDVVGAVKGFALASDVAGVENVVLTNASDFGTPTTNIFSHFVDLKSVRLLSDDYDDATIKVEDGVVYSVDGTILIAYLYRTVKNAQNEDVAATSFVVPDTVTTILPYAFVNSGLTEITVSASVTEIGENAFNDSLTTLNFATGIRLVDADRNSFDNTDWFAASKLDYVVNGSVVGFFYAAGNMLIGYDESAVATSLVIPNAINDVNITVIAGNINMKGSEIEFNTMVLPANLEKINSHAFDDVEVITNITCASTVLNDIADDVFSDTNFYKTNNNDMLRLGNVLLKWINANTDIVVPEGIVAISKDAFYGSQARTITLPSTLRYIGDYSFFNCVNLTEITVPDNVVSIGENAFAVCLALTSIRFNVSTSKLVSIGNNAFESCKALVSVDLPINMDVLGDEAFKNCSKLASLNFDYIVVEQDSNGIDHTRVAAKSNLKEIGKFAFYGCTKLTSITIPNNVTVIKESTFEECVSLDKVIFDTSLSKVAEIESRAFAKCTALGSTVDLDNPVLVTLVLPNSLNKIGDSAFDSCAGLLGVRLNYNVLTIGSGVFAGCLRLAKIEVYGSTPAAIQADSFERKVDENNAPVYRLRIYVLNSRNQTIKNNYVTAWSDYASSIYEISNVPTIVYTDGTNRSDKIATDIVVSPSYTFNNTNYTSWTYASFATVKPDGTEEYNADEPRRTQNIASGASALKQNNIPIVVVDYDIVTLQRVMQ